MNKFTLIAVSFVTVVVAGMATLLYRNNEQYSFLKRLQWPANMRVTYDQDRSNEPIPGLCIPSDAGCLHNHNQVALIANGNPPLSASTEAVTTKLHEQGVEKLSLQVKNTGATDSDWSYLGYYAVTKPVPGCSYLRLLTEAAGKTELDDPTYWKKRGFGPVIQVACLAKLPAAP